MQWEERKPPSGKYLKSYGCEHDGILVTVNLKKYEYESHNMQAWDVIIKDNGMNVGRGTLYDSENKQNINLEKIFEMTAAFAKDYLKEKVDYHRTNYEAWKSRKKRLQEALL